ncbi:MAG: translation initiation factor IF-3 [Clostridia bacterium]|nr:translation initiation factor IF-3 [Clostridia bacterium]
MVNEEIISPSFPRSKQVRVIGSDNEQLGILSLASALNAAYDKELDLVLIAPSSEPPVCRIMDYGKYCFDRDKKKKEAKKKQQRVDVKEIQLKCQIEQNDFNTKVNNARRFLTSGNKVKVMVVFRGRQMAYQDVGRSLLEKFSTAVADLGNVDKAPVMEGRSMTMFISPMKQTAAKQ